MMHGQKNINC